MELVVGMYAKDYYGNIGQIVNCPNDLDKYYSNFTWFSYNEGCSILSDANIIGEPSYEITDLIEKDDVIKHPVLGIRGIKNINVERKEIALEGMPFCINFENFKKAFELGTIQILTHEQFESMAYKVD